MSIDPFEADTNETEDQPDLLSLIIPISLSSSSSFLSSFFQFGFVYNRKLFDGWVKQPSPCCAAASLAGGLNCLANLSRSDRRSLNHIDILFIYCEIMKKSLEKKKKSFERCLGGSIDELLVLLEDEYSKLDMSDSKRKKGIGKITLTRLTKKIVIEKLQSSLVTPPDETQSLTVPSNPPTYELLKELFDSDITSEAQLAPDNDKEDENAPDDEEILDDEFESSDVPVPVTAPLNSRLKKSTISSTNPPAAIYSWDWQSALLDIFKKILGISKLSHSMRPNTAPIGNWGLIAATRYLAEDILNDSSVITMKALFGKGKKQNKAKKALPSIARAKSNPTGLIKEHGGDGGVLMGIRADDNEEIITEQWNMMRNICQHSNQVLLFHLKNHYALIYAMREWSTVEEDLIGKSEGGIGRSVTKVYREVLTAKRGQRPTIWISFDEVREIILSWEGYKMMILQRRSSDPEDIQSIRRLKEMIRQFRDEKEELEKLEREREESGKREIN